MRRLGEREYSNLCRCCRRRRPAYYGRCLPCRTPQDRRAIVEAGIPRGSADGLAFLVKRMKGKPVRKVEEVLSIAHPALMQNIRLLRDGTLKPRSEKYLWLRRSGWTDRPALWSSSTSRTASTTTGGTPGARKKQLDENR